MTENIALTKIGTELAAVADRLRAITVKVRSGNLGIGVGTIYANKPSSIVADVQLYPGNSGGSLADCLGKVVGINTMIVDGLAVAIPIAKVAALLGGRDRRASGLV